MARGKRLSEEVKRTIAMRVHNGDSKEELAKEFGVSEYTITDYARKFKSPRRVMRKTATKPAKQNTRVSQPQSEIEYLKGEVEFWKNAFIDEFRKGITRPNADR